jgi:hypothetical protein
VHAAAVFALAHVIAHGPAQLEALGGVGVLRVIERASAFLGVPPRRAPQIADACAVRNNMNYQQLVTDASG